MTRWKWTKENPFPPSGKRDRRVKKKHKTCPICAQRFLAYRSSQTYCSDACGQRARRRSVPEAIAEQAKERIVKLEAQAEKRRQRAAEDRERRERHRREQLKAYERDTSYREQWIADLERQRDEELAVVEPEHRDHCIKFFNDQLSKAEEKKAVPDFIRKRYA